MMFCKTSTCAYLMAEEGRKFVPFSSSLLIGPLVTTKGFAPKVIFAFVHTPKHRFVFENRLFIFSRLTKNN